uniref:Transcriptional regulator AsnC family n=1 Tax=uncultured marine thaumarchaeote KM3_70_F01 TaxID=1456255 RepID=A0A075HGG4_9ARCH|nr:hypothetical protein [uncultured marine thaumarchaeote KM3_70_F01]
MKSLCMINVKAGTVDKVLQILKKKRSVSKDIMIVTGRADICLILNGEINEINKFVTGLKNINEIVSTETLIEVEVDMGW